MFCKPCSGDLCEIHNFLFMQGLPLLLKRIRFIFENITGTSDTYSEAFEQISKIWIDSFTQLYVPYTDSMLKLSTKSVEISRGNASPLTYKEFHTLWMNTYQETYGRLFETQSMRPTKEVLEYFVQSENCLLYTSPSP